MPRSTSGIIGPSMDSQQNVFNIQYLGRCPMSNLSTGEGFLQSSLFDMYTKFKTKKGTKKLSNAKIVLSNRGLSLINWTNDEEFYALSSIVIAKALIFTGSKTKVSGTKYYKFAFENLSEIGRGSTMTTAMSKTFKYLLKVKRHQPLVVCILRRDLGPRVLEVHAFVCSSNDQALSLSYSIEMAKSVHLNEEKKNSNLFNYDPYPSAPATIQSPIQSMTQNMTDDQGNADLPQVMNILKQLGGGRGSVVNPVIKTSNVNLINDNFFVAPNKMVADKSQQNKMSVAARGQEWQSRIYQLNQEDITKPNQRSSPPHSGHNRSSSFDQLRFTVYQEEVDFKLLQQPKASIRTPVAIQRSKSVKHDDIDDFRQNKMNPPQHIISKDPSGGLAYRAEKPNKPVAMVQPRKINGIKVFPFGNDRTGLIPDKDKLRKKKNTEEAKSSSLPQAPDLTNLYSQVNKQVTKNPRNTFIMQSKTEDHLRKMMQDIGM